MVKEKICNKCGKKYYISEIKNKSKIICIPKNPDGCCVHTKGPFEFKVKEILGE